MSLSHVSPIAEEQRFLPRGIPADLDRTDHALWRLSWSPEVTKTIQIFKGRVRHRWAKWSFFTHYERAGCIFVHVPKNAGSSISEALFGRGIPHHTASYIRAIEPEGFDSLQSFATLRDPRSRFQSGFQYLKFSATSGPDVAFREKFLSDIPDLPRFIERFDNAEFRENVLRWPHFREQVQYVCDERGKFMLDFVLAVEKLELGWPHAEKLLLKSLELRHSNKSKKAFQASDVDWSSVDSTYEADRQLWQRAMKSPVGIAARHGLVEEHSQKR